MTDVESWVPQSSSWRYTYLQTVLGVTSSITFFQITSKVMHYFLIYKKISEWLLKKSNASYFVFPFIDWQVSCPHAGRNRKYRGVVCEHDVTVVLD